MHKIFYLIIFVTSLCFSQSPAAIWYFGKKAGIKFNSNFIPSNINNGELETNEGCATLCDGYGNLLFYTDGIKVWNKNHQVMPNGNDLNGDPSSTQSAIIVPKPGSTSLFYIFTVDELGKSDGLSYSIIDINLDGGNGDITTKNVVLITPSLEKITAVKHANQTDVWVIGHKYGNNSFVAYKLSNTGIGLPTITSAGVSLINDTQKTIGFMKSSPNGEFVVCANAGDMSNVQIFKFNNSTGQLSLLATSYFNYNGLGPYGVEFSSNSKLLYISRIDYSNKLSEVYQFNLESQNEAVINNSKLLIATQNFNNNNYYGLFASLQLGPDQKIYIARNNLFYLSAINNPNTAGLDCQFIENSVNLDNQCKSGLPSFVTSYLELNYTAQNFCYGYDTNFVAPYYPTATSYNWDFNDPSSSSNTSTSNNPSHIFSSSGEYTVSLTVTTNTTTNVFTKLIKIFDAPVANTPTPFIKCDENDNSTALFDLGTKNSEILGTLNSSDYNIKYFNSLTELNNNGIIIPLNYTNTSNPQIIYARIETLDGVCFDTTSFNLIVNPNPQLGPDEIKVYCKNDFPNTITISAENQNPSVALTFSWSNGATTENININQAGIYSVTATNSNNCSSTKTIGVTNSEIATITSIIKGQIGDYTVIVNATGEGVYSYSLDQEFGPYQLSSVFNNVNPGEHIIYVKDENNCGITIGNFSVIGFPKFFTPNNDGYNDYWQLQGNNIDVTSLRIFDRYGKLIQDVTSKIGWNGMYNGKDAFADDYWFVALIGNNETVKGHFALIR